MAAFRSARTSPVCPEAVVIWRLNNSPNEAKESPKSVQFLRAFGLFNKPKK